MTVSRQLVYLKSFSLDELQQLQQQVKEEIDSRQNETVDGSVNRAFNNLEREYNRIDWGDGDWKSEKTSDALGICTSLPFEKVSKMIVDLKGDCDQQWNLAIEYHNFIDGVLVETTDTAWKLVNGSMGDFCPDLAENTLAAMWKSLDESPNRPSEAVLNEAIDVCKKALEWDYWYGISFGFMQEDESKKRKREEADADAEKRRRVIVIE